MNEFTIPRIYAITDRGLSGLSHLAQCERLIEAGAMLIQIRDKSTGSDELFRDVMECVSLAKARGVSIIINDRVDIAIACEADGIHLGQRDMAVPDARKLLGPGRIIGVSTHNEQEVCDALLSDSDYIAIGPVFGTSSKTDPEPILGVDGFVRLREMIHDRPVVAIGGICPTNHQGVLSAGADSVAVISALYSPDSSIHDNFRSFGA